MTDRPQKPVKAPGYIENLVPYKAGKPISELKREKGLKDVVKLASNENPFGPSPKATAAMQDALSNLHRYVNPSAPELVEAIANKYGKKRSEVITGAGTDSLLADIIIAFSEADDEVLTSEGTFIGIYVSANKLGRKLVTVPLNHYRFDLDALANAITDRTRIIFLANPNNPTGTMFTKTQFEQFMAKVPGNVVVILDEAYFEYAQWHPDYPNGLTYDYPNLLVTRTLSKAYGLAGVRLGIALGNEKLISYLYRVKLPFEPNGMAQAAGVAALDDDAFVTKTLKQNEKSLQKMTDHFRMMGIPQIDTVANFVLLLFPSTEFAKAFYEECLNRGLIVRHVDTFKIPNGIRINSGTDKETDFALQVIDDVYMLLCKRFNIELAGTAAR